MNRAYGWKAGEEAAFQAFQAFSTNMRKVYVLRKLNLKTLNEHILSLAETDWYLFESYKILTEILAEPHPLFPNQPKGRIIRSNYKDTFIWTNLSAIEFETDIRKPFIKKMETFLNGLRPEVLISKRYDDDWTWADWLKESIEVGQGRTIEEAHFDAALKNIGIKLDAKNFQKIIIELRRQIVREIKEVVGISLNRKDQVNTIMTELVTRMQKQLKKGFREEFSQWLESKSLIKIFPTIEKYLEYLQTVDLAYYSPIKSNRFWLEERAKYFLNAKNAQFLFAFDIQALGAKARLQQDLWVAEGAAFNRVPAIYQELSEDIDRFMDSFRRWIKIYGGDLQFIYLSGDDGVVLIRGLSNLKRFNSLLHHIRSGKTPQGAPLDFPLYLSDLQPVRQPPGGIYSDETRPSVLVAEYFAEAHAAAQKSVLLLKDQKKNP